MPGQTDLFHGLRLLTHCGGGAFGDVYYCQDISGQKMAVKIVSKKKLGDSWARELKGVINYRKITEKSPELLREEATMFPVAADGADNHSSSSYSRFVRGDGSVGLARGNRSMKWYEDKAIRDFCRSPNDLPDYSF